jgi:hypothetical protein
MIPIIETLRPGAGGACDPEATKVAKGIGNKITTPRRTTTR